jgi:hypothetical protein
LFKRIALGFGAIVISQLDIDEVSFPRVARDSCFRELLAVRTKFLKRPLEPVATFASFCSGLAFAAHDPVLARVHLPEMTNFHTSGFLPLPAIAAGAFGGFFAIGVILRERCLQLLPASSDWLAAVAVLLFWIFPVELDEAGRRGAISRAVLFRHIGAASEFAVGFRCRLSVGCAPVGRSLEISRMAAVVASFLVTAARYRQIPAAVATGAGLFGHSLHAG